MLYARESPCFSLGFVNSIVQTFRCGIILNNVRVVDTYGWVQNEKKDQIGVISMKDKEIVHIEKLKTYDDEVYTEI